MLVSSSSEKNRAAIAKEEDKLLLLQPSMPCYFKRDGVGLVRDSGAWLGRASNLLYMVERGDVFVMVAPTNSIIVQER